MGTPELPVRICPSNFSSTCHVDDSFVILETLNSPFPYVLNVALNLLSAVFATIANVLSLLAIRRSVSIRLPSKLLLCSLILTDIGVGLVAQPLFVAFLITRLNQAWQMASLFLKYFFVTSSLFGCVSLLMMTVISIDRYSAMYFHLTHHEVVTSKRVCALLTIVWSFSVFLASTWFWSRRLYDIITSLSIFVCSLVTIIVYVKIRKGLVHPSSEHQPELQQTTATPAANRKAAHTMLWIYVIFVLCYLPYVVAKLIFFGAKKSALSVCLFEFCKTFLFLNSCINPIIYCFRLPEIRNSVVVQLRKCCCLTVQIDTERSCPKESRENACGILKPTAQLGVAALS